MIFEKMAPFASELHPPHGTKTKPRHGKSGDKPLVVRKPAHAHGNGNDITQTDSSTTDQSNTQRHQPEIRAASQSSQYVTCAQRQAARHSQTARPPAIEHASSQNHDQGKAGQPHGKGDLRIEFAPTRCLQLGRKDRPRVNRTQAKLNEDGANDDAPAVKIECIRHRDQFKPDAKK